MAHAGILGRLHTASYLAVFNSQPISPGGHLCLHLLMRSLRQPRATHQTCWSLNRELGDGDAQSRHRWLPDPRCCFSIFWGKETRDPEGLSIQKYQACNREEVSLLVPVPQEQLVCRGRQEGGTTVGTARGAKGTDTKTRVASICSTPASSQALGDHKGGPR